MKMTGIKKMSFACLLLAVLGLSGCVSKKVARAKARAAYAEGQASAFRQMHQEGLITSIQIIGRVRNTQIPWTEGLTLAQVLVQTQYLGQGDPGEIVIVRRGERLPIEVKSLLNGEDFPMEAGDTVEIRP